MKYIIVFCAILVTSTLVSFAQQPAPLGKLLSKSYAAMKDNDESIIIISLMDKGTQTLSASRPDNLVSARSLMRRAKVRASSNLVDDQDLPLEQSYVHAIEGGVLEVRYQLKWFNAVTARATKLQIQKLRDLPFVKEIDLVGKWKKTADEEVQSSPALPTKTQPRNVDVLNYGSSFTQLNQINVPAVHNLGIYGQGIVIGVFDNGVRLPNHEAFANMNIIATHDFVDHKTSVVPNDPDPGFGGHGVTTLSTIGGYKPGQLIGPAFDASFILARTENDSSETPVEEDNWAAAIQWADSLGIDVSSTSLGYLTYDPPYTSWTWQDMNGNTTLITKAADRAVGLGIVVVNSAGNSGYNASQNTLIAPADGDSVITAGAVDASGVRTSFSSVGPTTDVPPRIKPDIMAMGSGVWVASSTNPTGYGGAAGTSYSCPLSAGVAALILCANNALTPMQVRDAMRQTANNSSSPNNSYGWGILNTLSAINYFGIVPRLGGMVFFDKNANGLKDGSDSLVSGLQLHISGTLLDTFIINVAGQFKIDSLPFGTYTISITPPTGMKSLSPAGGTYSVTLDSTHPILDQQNFALVQYASIQGSVFLDNNGNGVQDSGEPGISSWSVHLNDSLTTKTDVSGNFTFSRVDGGSVTLAESLKAGWVQTSPAGTINFSINYGQELSGYHFGLAQTGGISGYVYNDSNANGIRDSGEVGIAGREIKLEGATTLTTLSDSNGYYIFAGLVPAVYTVSESLSSGWVQISPFNYDPYTVTIHSGLDTTGIDFGNLKANSVYSLSSGWNLLSIPQTINDHTVSAVYPTAESSPFIFAGEYIPTDTIPDHIGYWLKFPNSVNIIVLGGFKSVDTISVRKGWNIIGTLSNPLPVSSIITQPDSLISSEYYSYDNGYSVSDTLQPGRGYWVKVKNVGEIILQSSAAQHAVELKKMKRVSDIH